MNMPRTDQQDAPVGRATPSRRGMPATDDTLPVYGPRSPARRVLDLIADKWTPIILYCLSGGTRRFSELQRQIPGISKKMLTQVLRRLEADGLVCRTVHEAVPLKTDYALTDLGRRIHEPVALLCHWAQVHANDIEAVSRSRAGSQK